MGKFYRRGVDRSQCRLVNGRGDFKTGKLKSIPKRPEKRMEGRLQDKA